ncbi:hypothetical protein J3R82DRAFT_9185 [Butyriboletus roseoflavus]|nr:hypothetical protein J3R82DRAFT_9185 [Butyriboletus roseoflavus]
MTDVLDSVVITRNSDRYEYYQDLKTFEPAFTENTPLGAVQSHTLWSFLCSVYLTSSSPSYINGTKSELTRLTSSPRLVVRAPRSLIPPSPLLRVFTSNSFLLIKPRSLPLLMDNSTSLSKPSNLETDTDSYGRSLIFNWLDCHVVYSRN